MGKNFSYLKYINRRKKYIKIRSFHEQTRTRKKLRKYLDTKFLFLYS